MDLRTRVAIAADHAVLAWALQQTLSEEVDLDVSTMEISDLSGSLAEGAVDLAVVAAYPTALGADAVAKLANSRPGSRVAVVCLDDDPDLAARYLRAGAQGVFLSSTTPADLRSGLRSVKNGEMCAPPNVVALLDTDASAGGGLELSQREVQVMELLAKGWTNREIADHLTISIKTVDTHRGHVLKKLRLRNNSDLTRYAVRHGYVPL